MSSGWISVFLLLGVCFSSNAAPVCLHGDSVCHVPSVSELFDRVLQQSSKMFGLSFDLHAQMEEQVPRRNTVGKHRCHTHWIVTPGDKEKAQRLGREALTEAVLRLLSAWDHPLSELHWSMSQDQDHREDLSQDHRQDLSQDQDQGQDLSQDQGQDVTQAWPDKALLMGHMVRELREGVLKVTAKMRPLDENALSHVSPGLTDSFSDVSFYSRGGLRTLDQLDLLHCFRRDSSKIHSYLGLLKCSTVPEPDC